MMELDFDFDEWIAIASTDPVEFERRRIELIDLICGRLGGKEQPHIAGILCRIELERGRSRSSLQCCLRLSTLMWDRLFDLEHLLMTGRQRGLSSGRKGISGPVMLTMKARND